MTAIMLTIVYIALTISIYSDEARDLKRRGRSRTLVAARTRSKDKEWRP